MLGYRMSHWQFQTRAENFSNVLLLSGHVSVLLIKRLALRLQSWQLRLFPDFGSSSSPPWWRLQSGPFTFQMDSSPTVRQVCFTQVVTIECADHRLTFDPSFYSMVHHRSNWSVPLHPDPVGAAGGLCSLLKWDLGGQNGEWELQRLVCR